MQPLIRNIPPGGYTIPVPFGPPLEAGSFEELIDELIKYRTNNHLPLGDPRKDIQDYVIANFPAYAGSVSAEAPKPDEDALAKNQRERVSVWASNRYAMRSSGHTEFETPEVSEARSAICAQCPHNQPFVNDCGTCVDQVNRTLFLVRQGKTNSHEQVLHSCMVTGQDNLTASFLPTKMLAHRNKFMDELPDFCWLRQLEQ
jgi:hypothetical protein